MLLVPGRWVLREHRGDKYQRRYRLTENPDIIYRPDTNDLESRCNPVGRWKYIGRQNNIRASEEPHGSCTRKGWLLLLFGMAPWERLKFILVTHLLYSPEKTQKTRDITNSRAGETQLGFELTLPTSPRR
ncbi:hypothetical protein NQ317_009736 [Molorchus minor]|uniref:Uncharacterized protein n=1 Tax=Molorchus minor TaxID=1323400 RepID=A0ABQ9IQY5_9CUCU|nr:hypothetical protein NQ317_009736 [Molorchus minor]